MRIEKYGIRDIASWLLDGNDEVYLPAIQRGFVWRTYQIENLWDSMFREYPVGAFLLSDNKGAKELFDGQQRATAIALGFYNPWERHDGKERIGNDRSLPTIWVDLDPKEKVDGEYRPITTEGSVHLVRVLTKSHPWGYRAKNNAEKMRISDRVAAWEQLKGPDMPSYTMLKPSHRAPYSAYLPVPLCFLLEAAQSTEGWESFSVQVKDKCLNGRYIPEAFSPFFLHADGKTYREGLESLPDSIWKKWWEILENILDKERYSVPAVVVDSEVMNRSKDVSSESDPTLFVRLNSGGTNLQGEELMYSIFKACYPKGQRLVEGVAYRTGNLIAPSRVITLAARLAVSMVDQQYQKGMTPRAFQAKLASDSCFRGEMNSLVDRMGDLVSRAVDILRMGGQESESGRFVPDIVVKTFIKDSPDGVFLLLNYLRTEPLIDGELMMAICRKLYRNYWFGSLDKIAPKFWKDSLNEEFWRSDELRSDGFLQLPLISPDRLERFFLDRVVPFEHSNHSLLKDDPQTADIWSFFLSRISPEREDYIPAAWNEFLWKLLSSNTNRNKSFILLAQREYIRREFPDFNQLEDLQDSNTPWDWDHIFPRSWAWNGSPLVREWLNRIGNFRAMSLTDNRHESNNISPADRFSPRLYGLESDGDEAFVRILKDYSIDPGRDLPYWRKLTTWCNRVKGDRQFEVDYSSAMIARSVNIYRNFCDLFRIHGHDGNEWYDSESSAVRG